MNTRRLLVVARFSLLLLLPAGLFAKEEVLLDFKYTRRDPDGTVHKCYEYTFGDWGGGKVIDLRGKGALIQAPSGKGGLGENKTMLSFDKNPVIDLLLVVGNANQATTLNFGLTDHDGTEQTWALPLGGLPKGKPLVLRLDLRKPTSDGKPGDKPGLDLKRLDSWQFRGDYTEPKIEVLLIQLMGQQ